MDKSEMVLALGNALIMLDRVETKGAGNLNALLAGMQQVRKVYRALKEGQDDGKQDDAEAE